MAKGITGETVKGMFEEGMSLAAISQATGLSVQYIRMIIRKG